MSDRTPDNLQILSDETSGGNSAVVMAGDRTAIVELDPDHPGFRDQQYRARRNEFAQLALDYVPGDPLPVAPYGEHEHGVWREVWTHLDPVLQVAACEEYLRVSPLLEYSREQIPQLGEVSEKINGLSGFRLEPVGGLVHPKVFLSCLGDGIFLSTQYIRHHSAPLYTPEPDVVHELVGHAAMLASPEFVELTRLIGEAVKRSDSDETLDKLAKVYWFTIEFGVFKENGRVKAYGAGLLSSAGELAQIEQAELRPFDLAVMERHEYDVTRYQPILYCAESFDEMDQRMREYLAGF